MTLRKCEDCVHHESCAYYGNSGAAYHTAYYPDKAESCPIYKEAPILAIGDKVYQTDGVRIYESQIKKVIYCAGNIAFDKDAVGTSVFLTRQAAQDKLEGWMKDGK